MRKISSTFINVEDLIIIKLNVKGTQMITKDNLQDLLLSLGFVESSANMLTKTFKAQKSLAGGGIILL